MLTTKELTDIRSIFSDTFFKQTATISRKDSGTDSFGSPVQDTTTVASNIPCVVHSLSYSAQPVSSVESNRETLTDEVHIEFEVGTDVLADDTVTVDSITYQVTKIMDYRSNAFSIKVHGIRTR